ncbi:MAG: ribosomal-protein-alanine acetyltransferase [Pseudonocardiales bacterium]|nr:ribosomal-protein-alanine acetyltransferase [Pseudonocardiales bacterium]
MTEPEAGVRDTPDVVISPMTRAHISEIMPFEDELFGTESWSPESYRDELADKRYRHFVIAHDHAGAVLGWAGLLTIQETAQILTIGVVPSAQRHGVGQLLMNVLMDEARRRSATELLLEVRVGNTAAERMYERNGFVPLRIRRGYYDLGRGDAMEMRREL